MEKTYEQLGAEIGSLVEEKQRCYGDSFGKSGAILRVLYPDGISLNDLDEALTVIRVVDKLFRIATDRDALGESPWRDIAGYALLSVKRIEDSIDDRPKPAQGDLLEKAERERLLGLIAAMTSPEPDSKFDDEQNNYRIKAVKAMAENGWIEPNAASKARNMIRNAIEEFVGPDTFARRELERTLEVLK